MAKHRLETPHRGVKAAQGVVVAGTLTLGVIGATAAPALAAPVSIPGVGTIDIPGISENQVPKNLKPGASHSPVNLPKVTLPNVRFMPKAPKKAAPPAPPVKSLGERAAEAAESRIGSPYEYGAAGPSAFDCSGLVYWAYQQVGKVIPRDSYGQLGGGTAVSRGSLQPGDVLIFNGGSHAGIYIGAGQYVHSSTYGVPVAKASLASAELTGARRY